MELFLSSESKLGFTEATSTADLQAIESMARVIIPEVYGGYVPLYHCQFFIEQFQILSALERQLQQGYAYFLLQAEGENYGYFAYIIHKDRVHLSKLYLLASARGKGLGQLAMDVTFTVAKNVGINKIDLIVNRENAGAIAFYKRNGFQIADSIETDFGNGTLVKDYRMENTMR
jgi:ribosomal protein S18 acetylase RimI-like enzyme